ncbi:hypothetical protein GN956_G23191 [Arapaima gigas]
MVVCDRDNPALFREAHAAKRQTRDAGPERTQRNKLKPFLRRSRHLQVEVWTSGSRSHAFACLHRGAPELPGGISCMKVPSSAVPQVSGRLAATRSLASPLLSLR